MRSIVLGLAMLGWVSTPAFATTIFPYQETCPVGGEQFEAIGYGSYTTFGARLDGRPYGSSRFPLDIPVCPGNGFVLYKGASEFTAEQVAALSAYVAAEYRAIANETTHYRAAQLARVAGEPVSTQAWLMLRASWQASDQGGAQFERYQNEFVTLADAALRDGAPANTEWWMMQFRAANAERQLGRFDAALARLDALPMDNLASAGRDGQPDPDFAENYRGGLTLLRGIIEARDAGVEPEAARPRQR